MATAGQSDLLLPLRGVYNLLKGNTMEAMFLNLIVVAVKGLAAVAIIYAVGEVALKVIKAWKG